MKDKFIMRKSNAKLSSHEDIDLDMFEYLVEDT